MYGFIEKDSDLKIEDAVYDEVLNAGLGWMHELKKGQTFRILDIEGNQAVDTTFYDLENPEDHYGAVQTIVAQKNIYLTTGSILRAESGKPLLEITADQTRYFGRCLFIAKQYSQICERKEIYAQLP